MCVGILGTHVPPVSLQTLVWIFHARRRTSKGQINLSNLITAPQKLSNGCMGRNISFGVTSHKTSKSRWWNVMIAVNAEAVTKKTNKKLLRGDSESICLLRYGETSPRAFLSHRWIKLKPVLRTQHASGSGNLWATSSCEQPGGLRDSRRGSPSLAYWAHWAGMYHPQRRQQMVAPPLAFSLRLPSRQTE